MQNPELRVTITCIIDDLSQDPFLSFLTSVGYVENNNSAVLQFKILTLEFGFKSIRIHFKTISDSTSLSL